MHASSLVILYDVYTPGNCILHQLLSECTIWWRIGVVEFLFLPPMQFLDFVRVNFVMQLSRNLPTQLVGFDAKWPHAPQPLQETSDILKEMYRLYLARKFMRKLSPDDREQVCICGEGKGAQGRGGRETERGGEREEGGGGRTKEWANTCKWASDAIIPLLQYKMKLSASELFKDKKLAYPPSVPKPFTTTHLCK